LNSAPERVLHGHRIKRRKSEIGIGNRSCLHVSWALGWHPPSRNRSNFQVYDNYDLNAGGRFSMAGTFGFSAPFSAAMHPGSNDYTPIPMSGVVW